MCRDERFARRAENDSRGFLPRGQPNRAAILKKTRPDENRRFPRHVRTPRVGGIRPHGRSGRRGGGTCIRKFPEFPGPSDLILMTSGPPPLGRATENDCYPPVARAGSAARTDSVR